MREGNELIGVGVAAAGYHTNRSEADAQVRINSDGTADVFSATCDMGPGTYTSMTQVAADALGLSLQRVRFSLGDSRFPKAPSHSGSRTMASVGSAVFVASNTLRDKFIRTAVVDPGSPLQWRRPAERHGDRRPDVPDRRPHAGRDLSGSVASTGLAQPGYPTDLDTR